VILMQSPQVMLCKPSTNDRFDRRVIELAAFHHRMGHCNVPDVRPPGPLCTQMRYYAWSAM